jgi:hypothetical protein
MDSATKHFIAILQSKGGSVFPIVFESEVGKRTDDTILAAVMRHIETKTNNLRGKDLVPLMLIRNGYTRETRFGGGNYSWGFMLTEPVEFAKAGGQNG